MSKKNRSKERLANRTTLNLRLDLARSAGARTTTGKSITNTNASGTTRQFRRPRFFSDHHYPDHHNLYSTRTIKYHQRNLAPRPSAAALLHYQRQIYTRSGPARSRSSHHQRVR